MLLRVKSCPNNSECMWIVVIIIVSLKHNYTFNCTLIHIKSILALLRSKTHIGRFNKAHSNSSYYKVIKEFVIVP